MLVVPRPLLHPSLHALPLAFSHVWLFFPCCCWRMLSPSSCVGLGLSRSVSSTIRPILLSPHLISLNYLSSFSFPIPQFLSSAEFLLSPPFLPPAAASSAFCSAAITVPSPHSSHISLLLFSPSCKTKSTPSPQDAAEALLPYVGSPHIAFAAILFVSWPRCVIQHCR